MMKDINGYNIDDSVMDAIKVYMIERCNEFTHSDDFDSEFVITSVDHDKYNYHVEFTNHVFSLVSIPRHQINKIIRNKTIDKILSNGN